MNATPLRITLVQSNLHWENINANLEMFSQKLHGVKHTDLIVLPEMFSTGFSMNTHKLAEDLNGEAVNWMRETARKKKSVVTGSLMIKEEGRFYNRLVWMQPDGEFKTYDKRPSVYTQQRREIFYRRRTEVDCRVKRLENLPFNLLRFKISGLVQK
jgi:predicted amidohydrolase